LGTDSAFPRRSTAVPVGDLSEFHLSVGVVMGIVWMIIIGLVAGAIAKFIMPGRDPGGIIVTILLGIAGSVVGGMLFGGSDNRVGLIGSVVGALILLLLYRLLVGRRRTNI
jgi:uncharacterized membrane protein YeaQ/YmgE (transglycosylase-associated protein family)